MRNAKMITVKMTYEYKMTDKEFNNVVSSFMKELDFFDSWHGMTKDNNNIFLCDICEYIGNMNEDNEINEDENYEIKNTDELVSKIETIFKKVFKMSEFDDIIY